MVHHVIELYYSYISSTGCIVKVTWVKAPLSTLDSNWYREQGNIVSEYTSYQHCLLIWCYTKGASTGNGYNHLSCWYLITCATKCWCLITCATKCWCLITCALLTKAEGEGISSKARVANTVKGPISRVSTDALSTWTTRRRDAWICIQKEPTSYNEVTCMTVSKKYMFGMVALWWECLSC